MKKILEWIKTALWVVLMTIVLIGLIYFLFTQPELVGGAVKSVWGFLAGLMDSIVIFLESLQD